MAEQISDRDLYAQEQFARIAKMLDEAHESRQQSLRHQAEVAKIADEWRKC